MLPDESERQGESETKGEIKWVKKANKTTRNGGRTGS